MFKKIIALSLVLSFSTAALASSRVDNAIYTSTEERISKIIELEKKLVAGKKELTKFETQLNEVKNSSAAHKSFVSIRNGAGIAVLTAALALGGSLALQAGRVSTAKTTGKRLVDPTDNEYALGFIGLIGLPIASLFAVGGEVGVLLTKDEASQVLVTIKELKSSLTNKSNELTKEIEVLCKADPRREVCYLDLSSIIVK